MYLLLHDKELVRQGVGERCPSIVFRVIGRWRTPQDVDHFCHPEIVHGPSDKQKDLIVTEFGLKTRVIGIYASVDTTVKKRK